MKRLNSDKMKVMFVVIVAALVLGGESAKADFIFGEPTNLGPNVNSSSSDYGVSISADGLSLFLDSDRPDLADYDLYVATRETTEDEWGPAVNLGPTVNSPTTHNEGCPSISADGLELFFSGQSWQGNATGHGASDLWVTRRASLSDPWTAPENLGALVNTAYDDCEPSISADGLSLYLASDRPGGFSSWDLWVTTRKTKDDPWEEPMNLGEPINSYGAHAPSISSDGLVLFFSSGSSRGGLGQRDIWMARRATDTSPWGGPVNLGPAINTPAHDLVPCISHDGRTLYFCSWGRPAIGVFDIYEAPIIPIVDFNGDGIVDALDMCTVVDHWGEDYSLCDIGPTPLGDGIVDVEDLKILAEHLFEEPNDPTLIAHWALDEAEGMIAFESVSGNSSFLFGDPVWQPDGGIVAGALQFDGIDDYVSTPVILDPAEGDFTVFAWIKGGAPGQVIFSQAGGANWLCADASEGNLMTELRYIGGRASGPPLVSQTLITDDVWHRVALIWDGANRILYVDNVEVAKDTQPGFVSSEGGLYIGTSKDMAPGTYWSGMIDEVRIYNRAVKP